MNRNRALLLALLGVLLLAVLMNLCLGASGLSPSEILSALGDTARESTAARIFWYVRLPRTLAAILAGASLAAAGLLLQAGASEVVGLVLAKS